jgi:hypothetical protein
MKGSKKTAAWLAMAALSGLVAVGCSDATGTCVSYCQRATSCSSDGGGWLVIPSNCQESCNQTADAGYYGCKDPGAAYDCWLGLSCSDLIGTKSGGPSQAFTNCSLKADCPDAGS